MTDDATITKQSKQTITLENGLYTAAILLALFLRFFQLGKAPLNDIEASWALQALNIARNISGSPIQIGSQPGYVILTSMLLFLFKEANALARCVPAFAGSLLVCLPLILRPFFKHQPKFRSAGIFLAFALAADPALVWLSRTAGSAMPAISFTLTSLALYYCGRQIDRRFFRWAAFFGALALLSGPDVITGVVGLALAGLIGRVIGLFGELQNGENEKLPNTWEANDWLAGALTLGLVGTCFLLLPQGAAGFARILPDYLAAWITPSQVPAARLVAAVLLYQPAALLLGFVGGLRGWILGADESDYMYPILCRVLSIWAILALGLPLLQPGRQVSAMAWGIIPLWCLAALELTQHGLSEQNRPRIKVAFIAALVIGFFLLMGVYYGLYMANLDVTTLQSLLLLGGIALMAIIVIILVAMGWDFEIARCSSIWSATAILFVWMISSTWGMGINQPNHPSELWSNGSSIGQSQELIQTLQLLSTLKTGQKTTLDIISINPSPSLRWALRSFGNASFQNALSQEQLPAAIITDANEKSPALIASYRGQDFDWQIKPGWTTNLPPDMRHWMYKHSAPIISERLILWIRADVFPGGTLTQPSTAPVKTP